MTELDPAEVERRLAQLHELCVLGESLLHATLPPLSRIALRDRSLVIGGLLPGMERLRLEKALGRRTLGTHDVAMIATCADFVRHVGWMTDVCVCSETGDVVDESVGVLVAVSMDDRFFDATVRGRSASVIVRYPAGIPACLRALSAGGRCEHPMLLCTRRDRANTAW